MKYSTIVTSIALCTALVAHADDTEQLKAFIDRYDAVSFEQLYAQTTNQVDAQELQEYALEKLKTSLEELVARSKNPISIGSAAKIIASKLAYIIGLMYGSWSYYMSIQDVRDCFKKIAKIANDSGMSKWINNMSDNEVTEIQRFLRQILSIPTAVLFCSSAFYGYKTLDHCLKNIATINHNIDSLATIIDILPTTATQASFTAEEVVSIIGIGNVEVLNLALKKSMIDDAHIAQLRDLLQAEKDITMNMLNNMDKHYKPSLIGKGVLAGLAGMYGAYKYLIKPSMYLMLGRLSVGTCCDIIQQSSKSSFLINSTKGLVLDGFIIYALFYGYDWITKGLNYRTILQQKIDYLDNALALLEQN